MPNGAKDFAVSVQDQAHEEKVESRGRIAVGQVWTEWRLPLSDFVAVNMKSIANVNIGFNASDGVGRVCVGDIAFVT